MSQRRKPNRNQWRGHAKPLQSSFHSLLSKGDVVQLLEKDVLELVNSLSREIKSFQASLESDLCTKHLDLVLKLLHRVSNGLALGGDVCSSAINILGEVFQERCPKFQSQLQIYVAGKVMRSIAPEQNINLICDLFDALLSKLPESFWSILPIDELTQTVNMLSEGGNLKDAGRLQEKVKSLNELRSAIKEQKIVKQMRSVVVGQKVWDNTEYRQVSILPKWDEISTPKPPYKLRPNIVDGEYEDWMHYFDVQFRLLREDFISPLRKGIRDYHDGKVGKSLSNLRVYNDVRILRPLFTQAGLCHKIAFSTAQFFRCNWEHSKRLIFGSLLCLSPDNFYHKVLFATVTNRDPRDLARGMVEVMFQDGAEVIVHQNKRTKFVMVESVAFFEASRHILRSLQVAEESTMPFTKHLIKCDSELVNPPKYLAHRNRLTPYNLTLIIKEEVLFRPNLAARFSSMDIQNNESWPPLEDTQLDESQLLAMKMALKQEISVIQGPPGTGKTYIGLKIVKALLNNFNVWGSRGVLERAEEDASVRSPILVMCFTNHALDQFLEGIMDLDTKKELKLIRVGGRSKNEKLQDCNLNSVKRKLRNVPRNEYQHMKYLISDAEQTGAVCLNRLNRYKDTTDDFVSFSGIRHVISEYHIRSLFEPAESKEEREYAIELWLGLCVKTIREELVPVEYQQDSWEEEVLSSEEDDTESEFKSGGSEFEDNVSNSEMVNNDISEYKQEQVAMKVETITVKGEGTHEQEARLMEDTVELFKELNLEDVLVQNQVKKFRRTHNIRRIVKVEKCENYYFFLRSKMREVTVTSMDDLEAEDIDNVNQLTLNERWELYKYWHFKYRSDLLKDLEMECMRYNDACAEVRAIRQRNERYALETAHVIGMTTTGAAKYQHILHMLKPRIVIVEEAAEVLESHIVSALNAGTQQLILIGDHKQLRPKPNEFDLAVKYKLDISLFERLVRNNFPHATLQNQHRMRPEIAELVRPHIYETLHNHESVQNYPSVKGISSDIFLICHNEPEQPSNDLSHSNRHEARYLIALCRYLLQHDYQPSQITILVTYTGQLLLMKNEMPKSEFEGVRITTVDNYQGEENDIILLSLVRSNSNGTIGFLKEENRVCVSLSRAKHGFYCIGNFTMLREKSEVWQRIVTDMESKGRVGNGLAIHCTNHPNNKYIARNPTDFAENSPKGGCKLDCGVRLKCGHTCPLKCHTSDPEHLKFECPKPCSRTCSLGHKCYKPCHEECQCTEWVLKKFPNCEHEIEIMCYQDIKNKNCRVKVEKIVPTCNHLQQMLCHKDPANFLCQFKVEKILHCGHKHVMPCNQNPLLHRCSTLVSRTHRVCGHTNDVPCYTLSSLYYETCSKPCENSCPKGHQCQMKCHKSSTCPPCEVTIEAIIPGCGHKQTMSCYKDPTEVDCMSKCQKACKCGHPCPLYCYESCQDCTVKIEVNPECGHACSVKCSKVDQFHCTTMVSKTLKCGHNMKVHCSKSLESILCTAMIDVTLNICGHKQTVLCSTDLDNAICKEMVEFTLKCSHVAFGQCSMSKSVIKCMEVLNKTLKCGHQKVLHCYENPDEARCVVLCTKQLGCGHTLKVSCYKEVSTADCTKPCSKSLPCGHTMTIACNSDTSAITCDIPVTLKLPSCNHTMIMPCFQASISADILCPQICNRELRCGHKCKRICNEDCFCTMRCKRKLECGHDCKNSCIERCTTKCRFLVVKAYPCGHKHRLPCYMPIEDAPCDMFCRAPLACGHLCQGMCSDCNLTRIHNPCTYTVSLRHYCGERTRLFCSGISDKHTTSKGQVIECPHGSNLWKCYDPLPFCRKPCQWACPKNCRHPKTCSKACYEHCDRDPCNKNCAEVAECGHRCVGLCGEPCITLCPLCNPEQFASQHKLSKPFSLGDRYIQLPCGHIFTVSYMDDYVMQKSDVQIFPLHCPACFAPLSSSYRYGNLVKVSLRDVEAVSTIIKEKTSNKRSQILGIYSEIMKKVSTPWLNRIHSQKLIHCLTLVMEKLKKPNFSPEEEFLLFLFVKFLEEFPQTTPSGTVRLIVDNVCGCLLLLLNNPMLSYQVISDLVSEYYRFILEVKLYKLPSQRVTEEVQLLKSINEDSHLRISRDLFNHQSRLLDEKRRKNYMHYRATDGILADIELFLPVIQNGSWRKCTNGHYYCVPVSRPGSLHVQCGQCLGKYIFIISFGFVQDIIFCMNLI